MKRVFRFVTIPLSLVSLVLAIFAGAVASAEVMSIAAIVGAASALSLVVRGGGLKIGENHSHHHFTKEHF